MSNRGSSGRGLVIVAIILAIGALSLQLYSMFIVQPDITTRRTWYASNEDIIYTNPTHTYLTIPELTINFDIKSGENLYVLFSSRVGVREINTWNYVEVYLAIDGVRVEEAFNKFLLYTTGGGSTNIVPMTLQYSFSGLANGAHTLTVVIYGSYGTNYVNINTLFAQTYVA